MRLDNVKSDVILKNFWRSNERFADLFNAVIFGGKEILHAECLEEMDTRNTDTLQRCCKKICIWC